MKKIFKITFYIILISLFCLYFGITLVLPQIISTKAAANKLQSLIHNKTGAETKIEGLKLKIYPNLVAVLNIDNLDAKDNNVKVMDIKKLSLKYKLLQNRPALVSANNIYIDGNFLNKFKKTPKKKKKKELNLNKVPEIHIQNFAYKSDNANIQAQNIDTKDNIIQLKMAVNAPFLKETLKLGESGSLQIAENKLKANQFKVVLGNSNLYLDGVLVDKENSKDFNIKGEKLPVSEIMPMLLHFQKSKDPSKKFIENFRNYKGTVDVDLKVNKEGIWGKCIANNLGANAVWFNIPLFFKEAVFNFKGKTVDSVAHGILGNEKVTHTLDITEMGTPEKLVVGKMFTTLTPKFHFVPNLTILNSANVSLIYKIKHKKPNVYYNIDIPVNSDLIYNSFYLGLKEHKRKISAHTLKDGNSLYLKEYKYAYSDANKENIIIAGDGLFIKNIDKKNPDKFIPQYLTIRTVGYAPTSIIGSFGEKVRGGEFRGDLKYDFKNNQILGTFDIIKARHKAFKIEKAHIVSKNGVMKVVSSGLFKGEKYSAQMDVKNNIFGETLIYNMKLFLDKLVFEVTEDTEKKKRKIDSKQLSKTVKDIDITINNWEILVNEIKREGFVLQNVKLIGSMKNNIFNFKMEELNFADGTINATGIYDFTKNTSKMAFEAKDINSNKAANMMLNLQNQVEGTANAKVDLDAKDMFRYLDIHSSFEIKEGFMPRLGDTEFMVENSKYKLSQITNFDLTQKDLMKDDIVGSFDVHNTEIKNINLTTWHELSAMFLEGSYEMEKQYADLQLFWHYSKEAPKGIRIFCVPLSLILKVVFRPEHSKELYKSQLSKIPKIKDNNRNSNYYRIFLKGDINNKKTTVELKEIR